MTTGFTSLKNEKESHFVFQPALFEEQVNAYCKEAVGLFKQITRSYALFQMVFFAIGIFELFLFLLFFSFFTRSTVLAFSLATLFLTGFSYFVLLFYFQAKKPEELSHLKKRFLQTCRGWLPFPPGKPELHLSMARATSIFASHLQNCESDYYQLPKRFETLAALMEKFSAWSHWKDVHKMKELLLFVAIEEHIQLIKARPTDLEVHASLANTYFALSKLYMDPRKQNEQMQLLWVSPEFSSAAMQEKFKAAAERAIEELKILDDYIPNDLWVHAQLATIYHHLEMPEQEIQEYETMLKNNPEDGEILFRLGMLYFQQGLNAQGLRIYEKLRAADNPKCEELVLFYDASLDLTTN